MLDKTLSPASFEQRLYEGWEAAGKFGAHPDSTAAPFTIMIPPPNVTGSLHIGHALTFTIQDTLIRWRRMQGRDALWQPGTDHAGIATQMVVERLLAGQGVQRREIGREKFLEHVWAWKGESGGSITRQLRRLGASLDWPRERFTMDEGLSQAVREVFVTLHEQGLIYRDRRLVNWDPKFQTAISDLEVESRDVKGSLWHLRYPVEGEPGRFIVVATTRPETMLGDTAIAVHPEDERFRDLIGKFAILPLVGRRIPIVADEYSDPEKGSGAVKITPAHDFNDFAVGKRHNLAMPSVLDADGAVMLAEIEGDLTAIEGVADPAFVRGLLGQDRFAARKAIVAELERLELVEQIEPHSHAVPHGDRSGVPIEPRLTLQWYCDAATLAKPAIEAVETGKTEFVPKHFENIFFSWMRDIQPWCISRQLWWGHQIPAWYAPDGSVFVARTEEEALAQARQKLGADVTLTRDEDVLDTWFSSALWPFSTLGWPNKTAELEKYYPGDVLVTGWDIIFFWVARMMMMGIHFMGDVPFKTVYIHGLVRDEKGQKMSKSKGNVIDPLELVDSFGADALRFAIASLATPGRDVKLGRKRVEDFRSFGTKIWNAARFCEMNGIGPDAGFDPAKVRTPLARWILDASNTAIAEANAALEAYRMDDYASACYRFVWNSFCDWFLEFAKPALNGPDSAEKAEVKGAAQYVLGTILKLLHPVMPYLTEELWDRFGYGPECSLIGESWPTPVAIEGAAEARAELDWLVSLISAVRGVRAEMNVPPSITVPLLLQGASPETLARGARWIDAIRRLGRATEFRALAEGEAPKGAQLVVGEATILLPLADVIDLGAERARLGKERDKALAEAAKVEQKLANADFVARAKPEVVEENRERLTGYQAEVARLEAALARIAG
ncbi:valine--tRNA ligase [Teichococcus cervicalis]|uniref:Valine--tRNA ligase n=1 Tax=Pseudoroseomonas cervicalis ATCC 49957 TaxID=525371 RepID=D5RQ08_9PROT|nr:valine--tRNA ligase [Pseudoroseomonas cervicalis]EFH10608.1 valine--tRNA ligase [Pseudoroseomonas cervicalis ATCC 49957]